MVFQVNILTGSALDTHNYISVKPHNIVLHLFLKHLINDFELGGGEYPENVFYCIILITLLLSKEVLDFFLFLHCMHSHPPTHPPTQLHACINTLPPRIYMCLCVSGAPPCSCAPGGASIPTLKWTQTPVHTSTRSSHLNNRLILQPQTHIMFLFPYAYENTNTQRQQQSNSNNRLWKLRHCHVQMTERCTCILKEQSSITFSVVGFNLILHTV